MKFCVCIKQVPDVTVPLQVRDGQLTQDTERMVLDAYSASAVEESLVLAGKYGGDVAVISIGPAKAKETIRKALAMGAAKAIHVVMEDANSHDSAAFAEILAAYFKNAEFDVIATGKQAQDTDAGLTGSMLAEKLGLPYATNAVGLDVDADARKVIVTRQGDTGQEVVELPMPCLVTCSNDMNDPRIPSLKGIMQSKRKPFDNKTLGDLGIDAATLKGGQATHVTGYQDVPGREPGQKFEGEADELAKNLVNLLENEAKVL